MPASILLQMKASALSQHAYTFWQNLNCVHKISIVNGHHPFATMSIVCCMYGLVFSINDHEPNPWCTKFCGKIALEDTRALAIDPIWKRISTSPCDCNLASWNNLHDTSIVSIPRACLSVVWMRFAHYWHGSPFPSCMTRFRQSFNSAGKFLLVMNTLFLSPPILQLLSAPCSSVLSRILTSITASNRPNVNTHCNSTACSWLKRVEILGLALM